MGTPEAINSITTTLGYSLDEIYITEAGEVWTKDDLREEREISNTEAVQTAHDWYELNK